MHMGALVFPTNAPVGGATQLSGGGSANDEFTFSAAVRPQVQNQTAAAVNVAWGVGTPRAATQGDYLLGSAASLPYPLSDGLATWISIYGAAGTHVNGTAASGIWIAGVRP